MSGLRAALGEALAEHWWRLAKDLEADAYQGDGAAMGRRRLRRLAIAYLAAAAGQGALDADQVADYVARDFDQPDCMTNALGALQVGRAYWHG